MSLGSAVAAIVLAVSAGVGAVPVDPVELPRAKAELSPNGGGRWSWPLEPVPEVARRFDPPDQPWLPGHRGVDLISTVGQVVRAPAPGTVTYAGRLAWRGVVVVSHSDGLRSTFEPVETARPVGSTVAQGDSVGRIGAPAGHCAPVTCLHWGVLRGRTYLDPLAFVGRARIVLLPLH